jgi:hypothetical protein
MLAQRTAPRSPVRWPASTAARRTHVTLVPRCGEHGSPTAALVRPVGAVGFHLGPVELFRGTLLHLGVWASVQGRDGACCRRGVPASCTSRRSSSRTGPGRVRGGGSAWRSRARRGGSLRRVYLFREVPIGVWRRRIPMTLVVVMSGRLGDVPGS